mmetsp:Transcript_144237/g.401947  ORF Transcript_144237/g.401947 Transcript_144237/m.401947 type:complete len:201 (+) Transcript_144237:258-860(+)
MHPGKVRDVEVEGAAPVAGHLQQARAVPQRHDLGALRQLLRLAPDHEAAWRPICKDALLAVLVRADGVDGQALRHAAAPHGRRHALATIDREQLASREAPENGGAVGASLGVLHRLGAIRREASKRAVDLRVRDQVAQDLPGEQVAPAVGGVHLRPHAHRTGEVGHHSAKQAGVVGVRGRLQPQAEGLGCRQAVELLIVR